MGDAEHEKRAKSDTMTNMVKANADADDKLEQVRSTTAAAVSAVDKAVIDAKLAAQNADYAETKVQEHQLEHEELKKEQVQADSNYNKQLANQKQEAEQALMQQEDSGEQQAAADSQEDSDADPSNFFGNPGDIPEENPNMTPDAAAPASSPAPAAQDSDMDPSNFFGNPEDIPEENPNMTPDAPDAPQVQELSW